MAEQIPGVTWDAPKQESIPGVTWDAEPQQDLNQIPGVKMDDPDTSFFNNLVDDTVKVGKMLKYGYDKSAASIYNTLANIPMLIADTEDYVATKVTGKPSKEKVFREIEGWFRNMAQGIQPSEDEAPQTIIGKLYAGIGEAPGMIAQFVPAVKAAGAVKGMAGISALQEAEKGGKEAAVAAAKGAIGGKILEGVAPFTPKIRMASMAAFGGTQVAAEGGNVEDVVANSLTMGMLGAIGPTKGIRLEDLKPTTRIQNYEDVVVKETQAANQTKEYAGNILLDKYKTTDEVKGLIKDVADQHANFSNMRRDVVSHDETKLLAKEMGMTYKKLTKRTKGQAFNAHEAYASRVLLADSAERLFELSNKAKGGSNEDIVALQEHLLRHVAIQEHVAGMTAEAGRALNQFKIDVKSSKAKIAAINDLIEQSGGREKIEKVAELLSDPANANRLNELSRKVARPKPSDMALEVWINSLLSGPQTHAVNIVSNAATALWTVPENAVAATIGKFRSGKDKVTFREVGERGLGFIEGAKEGIVRAAEALKTGEPVDPLSKLEVTQHQAVPGPIGEVVRIPGRFLTAEDEFFKAVGYRMELNALAYRQALSEGLKNQALGKRIEELKVSPTEEMHQKATENARYQTFTKPLGPMGRHIQSVASSHPTAKLIMPFIRTPVNIVKFAGERTPLSLFSKEVRETIKKGGAEADQQLAKIAIGSMVTGVVASMVHEGLITGGGPTDPKQRAMLYTTGWQPYSIKVDDKYYAYSRIEPLGMVVGVNADAAEIAGKLNTKEADEIGALVFASVSKNLTSKTWLKGVADMIQAIQDPDRYGERWIQGYAGSLVPTVAAQVARVEDPVLRETGTWIEKIKSRIPGISETLLPRRNLWGEEIRLEGGLGPDIVSPIYQSTIKHDKVSEEFVRLEIAPGMPRDKINGVKLTPEQYDDFVQFAGKPAKEMLDSIIVSDAWDNYPDFLKARIMTNVVRDFRDVAEAQMFNKYPELLDMGIEEKLKQFAQ